MMLHWLDMTDRIQFRKAVTVYRCLRESVPGYLHSVVRQIIPLPSSIYRQQTTRRTSGQTLNLCTSIELSPFLVLEFGTIYLIT